MLPAYLGLFLARREDELTQSEDSTYLTGGAIAEIAVSTRLGSAVIVAATVTAGFVLLFGGVGIIISAGGRFVVTAVPWMALGIGFFLALLGLAMLGGYQLSANFADRLAQRIGNPGTANMRGFFVFGVAYGTASLSCTLPIFLTVVGGSLTAGSFGGSATQFISYALGMGSIILALTISIAVLKERRWGNFGASFPTSSG